MKKVLAAIFAGLFALTVTVPAVAAEKDKKEETKKDDKKKKKKKEDAK